MAAVTSLPPYTGSVQTCQTTGGATAPPPSSLTAGLIGNGQGSSSNSTIASTLTMVGSVQKDGIIGQSLTGSVADAEPTSSSTMPNTVNGVIAWVMPATCRAMAYGTGRLKTTATVTVMPSWMDSLDATSSRAYPTRTA